MRRKDREMPREFALAVIDKCMYATLSTAGADGMPYGIPVSPAREGDAVYFHCAAEGMKTDNMRANPNVCLSCVGDVHVPDGHFTTEYESAVCFGTVGEVTDPAEKIHALRLICLRYTPGNMAAFDSEVARSLSRTAVWKLTIRSLTGKRKRYDASGREMTFGRTE